jgi:hypothetical protein
MNEMNDIDKYSAVLLVIKDVFEQNGLTLTEQLKVINLLVEEIDEQEYQKIKKELLKYYGL